MEITQKKIKDIFKQAMKYYNDSFKSEIKYQMLHTETQFDIHHRKMICWFVAMIIMQFICNSLTLINILFTDKSDFILS